MCDAWPFKPMILCTRLYPPGTRHAFKKSSRRALLYQDQDVSSMQDVYWCFNVLYSLAINKKYIYNALIIYTARTIFQVGGLGKLERRSSWVIRPLLYMLFNLWLDWLKRPCPALFLRVLHVLLIESLNKMKTAHETSTWPWFVLVAGSPGMDFLSIEQNHV